MAGKGHIPSSESQTHSIPDADELIDEILATKGPQRYVDGLSEDNWEKEIEYIPLFMTKLPTEIDPVNSPGLVALQELKYKEDTPEGRALAYKEDGNELFKQKKYKNAVKVYSEGLKQQCSDQLLNAVLYCNRAAANYHLGNMRSSILDATESKEIKPDHLKAYIRGAEANMRLNKYDGTITWCDDGLRVDPINSKLKELRIKATQDKKKYERDQRRQKIADKEKIDIQRNLIDAIQRRGIRLVSSQEQARGTRHSKEKKDDFHTIIDSLHLTDANPISKPVHLDEQDKLVWPVMFLYPEYGQSEVILEFHEEARFVDHINVMFGDEFAPWDVERKYTADKIEIWYEDLVKCLYIQVSKDSTLGDVINHSKRYIVVSGTPTFIVLVTDSDFKNQFIKINDNY